ncbi:MAG TPA: ABC transporter substrate-binding protein [Anaerolineaceae bacterium]|nr:ABC transporter substrate-binding protein [Anaerolineaceae bacterium]HPN53434.1 ABC transporter substrate-binding protein [Anaerolineaceae bacterium]
MYRRIWVLVLCVTILSILAACTAPVPPTTAPTQAAAQPTAAPAAGSGKLTVLCTPQEDWCVALTKAFQAETGIETNYVRLSSGEAVARLRAGKDNPEFDVWFGGPMDGYEVAKAEGLVEPYVSPNAAVIKDSIKDKDGYWTGIYVGAFGFCSNKDVLASLGLDVPNSWDDLLDPKLKGQIAMAHPATSGTAFTAFWTVVTLNGGDIDKAFEYFKKLNNNILQYTKTGSAPGPMAGRGEIAIALIFSHDCVKFQKEGMTSLVTSFPAEGTGYEVGGVGIVKGAKNIDAAKKWVDWVLTAKVQEIAATVKSFQLPTNPDAAVPPEAVKLDTLKLVNYDFVASAAAKKGITERFDAEIAPAPKE